MCACGWPFTPSATRAEAPVSDRRHRSRAAHLRVDGKPDRSGKADEAEKPEKLDKLPVTPPSTPIVPTPLQPTDKGKNKDK